MTGNLGIAARTAPRSSVRLYGQVKYMNSLFNCRVVNLSPDGICVRLDSDRDIERGMTVSFQSDELGHLEGKVSWSQKGTIGIRLKHTTSTLAQVSSYFRFFHEEVTPVLRR